VIQNLKVLDDAAQQRCQLGLRLNLQHAAIAAAKITQHDLTDIWKNVYQREFEVGDVDESLYSGFIGNGDRQLLNELRSLSPERLAKAQPNFTDSRLTELLFRYRARNFPQTLSDDEHETWQQHCAERLFGGLPGVLNLDDFFAELERCAQLNADNLDLLHQLNDYAHLITPEN
jgi:exodeoxyribonuclease-1